jgi:hypothetical protein
VVESRPVSGRVFSGDPRPLGGRSGMAWFSKARKRKTEARFEPVIRFICEQVGQPESNLKDAVKELLPAYDGISRAYLVRIEYGDASAYEVAMCFRGNDNPRVVKAVSECFQSMFGPGLHLDVMFLTDAYESELCRVCAPFYIRAAEDTKL